MVDALRRASAKSITAKLVANLIAASGVDRVLTVDLHAHQFQGFFDLPLDHLYATPALIGYLKGLQRENPVMMSPDAGSVKMATRYAKQMNCNIAIIEKKPISDETVETGYVMGDVKGADVIIAAAWRRPSRRPATTARGRLG